MPVMRKKTAMNAPHGLNRPGVIAVAPRNTAAKAGSRYAAESLGDELASVPTSTTPASELTMADTMSDPARMDVTGIPDISETCRFAPTKWRYLPSGVNEYTYQAINVRISPYQNASGSPTTFVAVTLTSPGEIPATLLGSMP